MSDDDAWRPIDDALVLALHASDDGEVFTDDIELEFELADHPVTALASVFLERWLPRLPRADAIVLATCNPHLARLRAPEDAAAPIHYAIGDVTSWLELGDDARPARILLNAQTWHTLPARRPPCPRSN